MNKRYISYLMVAFAVLVAAACTYDEKDQLDGKGLRRVYIISTASDYGQQTSVTAYNPVKESRVALEIVREATSNADLQTEVTVHYALDTGVFTVENDSLTDNEESTYLSLPAASYVISGDGIDTTAHTITFKAGEANKSLMVTVDPDGLDFTARYGIPIRLVSVSAPYVISAPAESVILNIVVKNVYDGVYTVTGTLVDATTTAIGPILPSWEGILVTDGPTKCYTVDNTYSGQVYHPIFSGGANNVYGNFSPEFDFAADGTVVSVTNAYTPESNVGRNRTGQLDPDGINKYDLDKKIMKVSYWLNQDDLGAPGTHRTHFVETWTYKGPR